MQNKTLLMVGLGDLGSRIANLAQQQGIHVMGMRRGASVAEGIRLIRHDARLPWPRLPSTPDDIVFCLSPDASDQESYQQAYVDVAKQASITLRQEYPDAHVWLVSSTGVYGQSDGEWVDERSERHPTRETAQVLVDAENCWLESTQPVTILRPSGIYGPGRFFLIRQAQQGFLPPTEPPIFTNRIHIEDAARAVIHLILRRHQGLPIDIEYNVTDTDPASLYDILCWLHQQMGIQVKETRAIQRESKRVRHDRLKQTGFVWRYPDFKVGYASVLSSTTQA